MDKPPSTSSVISSYRRRRQQQGPFLIYGAAVLLVIIGLILLIVWLSGPSKPLNSLFATDTPTPSITPSPTNTSTPTETATVTLTPTDTSTVTPSAPFDYTVQEGDYLASIVQKYNLGDDGIPLILLLNNFTSEGAQYSINPTTQVVYPGQIIRLPYPGMKLPTATPIPPDLPHGTKLNYVVQAGDSLAGIASKFNSTIDDIVKANNLTDPNAISVGQQLVIPVNMVTPTATRPPTSTPARTNTPPLPSETATPTP
ncbi:MAG TPA: LysM peptidoglycan-binding domain-containing protein [Anaerolineales bacterium]|nr:LysM peptidoglycan-binding domain-containing protein [Anaerolineales bacterium]